MKAAAKKSNHWGRAARVFRCRATTSVVATIVLALLWGPVLAAEQATTENVAATPAPQVPEDEFGRGSPRGTVKGFFFACREGDYEKAANYLDLRRIPGDGPTLARQIKTVLSRVLWVDFDALSPEHAGRSTDGLPTYRERLGTIDTKVGKADILRQRVPREDGVAIWKFAGATVAQVPDLYKEFGYGVLERFLPEFFFNIQFLDIVLWQWIGLLVLVLFTAVASWLLTIVTVRALKPLVARTETPIDDRMLAEAASPIRLAMGVLVFHIGVVLLGLGVQAKAFISALLGGLLIVAVTWLLVRVTDVLSSIVEEQLIEKGRVSDTALVPPGRKFVKAIVVLLALVAILSNFGFNVAALVAGLGVGGIAIALAAQKTIENLFGG
ncbi:MAG: mechanosensitive ion channel, partial [Deltaproteobacteria bacterium]